MPETSEDIALKHVARYLEAQRLQQRLHRSHLTPYLSPMHKKHAQKERDLLETLNKIAQEDLIRQELKMWTRNRQHHYPEPVNRVVSERDYPLPYYDLDLKLDYPDPKQNEDDRQDYRDGLGYGYKARTDNMDMAYGRVFDADKGVEEPVVGFHDRYRDRNHAGVLHEGSREAVAQPATIDEPEFTYKFDNSNLEEKHPFAVKPNDPRYYSNAPFSSGKYIYVHINVYTYVTILLKWDRKHIDAIPSLHLFLTILIITLTPVVSIISDSCP